MDGLDNGSSVDGLGDGSSLDGWAVELLGCVGDMD